MELLVSISIFGIAVLAILGALSMSASSSSLHEGQAKAQNLLRNWAESVTQAGSSDSFWTCPATLPTPTFADGYTALPPSFKHWNPAPTELKFNGSCSTTVGLRLVHLTVRAPSSMGTFDQSLDVVVRKPCSSLTGPESC